MVLSFRAYIFGVGVECGLHEMESCRQRTINFQTIDIFVEIGMLFSSSIKFSTQILPVKEPFPSFDLLFFN